MHTPLWFVMDGPFAPGFGPPRPELRNPRVGSLRASDVPEALI
jgi:hypothetical protein